MGRAVGMHSGGGCLELAAAASGHHRQGEVVVKVAVARVAAVEMSSMVQQRSVAVGGGTQPLQKERTFARDRSALRPAYRS